MKIHYDKIADAMYFLIKKGKVAKTVPLNGRVYVDLDKEGETVGIELLEASSGQSLTVKETIQDKELLLEWQS